MYSFLSLPGAPIFLDEVDFVLRAVASAGAYFRYVTVGAAREVQNVPYKIKKSIFDLLV